MENPASRAHGQRQRDKQPLSKYASQLPHQETHPCSHTHTHTDTHTPPSIKKTPLNATKINNTSVCLTRQTLFNCIAFNQKSKNNNNNLKKGFIHSKRRSNKKHEIIILIKTSLNQRRRAAQSSLCGGFCFVGVQ